MTLGAIPEAKVPREDELERDEKFSSGRVILVAIDHGPQSQAAFAWALDQFVTHADTIYLLHVLPKSGGGSGTAGGSDVSPMYYATELLFDKMKKEAIEKKCQVKVITALVFGEPGKEIVAEANSSRAVAIVMGCRGLGAIKSLLVGSATDYCLRHSTVPIIIIPHQFHADPSIPAGDDEKDEPKEGWKVDGS